MHLSLKTDGGRYSTIIVPGGAFLVRCNDEEEPDKGCRRYDYPLMNGTDVFNLHIHDVPVLIKDF